MEPPVNIFAANLSCAIAFQPFPDNISLPFPLSLSTAQKYLLLALYFPTLVLGTRLRKTILAYMPSAEANLGPINSLIWIDHLNGINLFLSTAGIHLADHVYCPKFNFLWVGKKEYIGVCEGLHLPLKD